MDYKEKFNDILPSSDTVLWVGPTDKKAFVKSHLLTTCMVMLFTVIGIPLIPIVFTIFLPLLLYVNKRLASNYFVCVTDKVVILRYGYFRAKYEQIRISDIAKIDIHTRITDKDTSSLILCSRYHAGEEAIRLVLENLPNYQEVYKIISEKINQN